MADLKQPAYVNLTEHLRSAISSHQALVEGIADHGEKERAKREELYHQQKLAEPLKQITSDGT